MTYPKRLIEVDLPIKRISAHARREKCICHGHISTLHILLSVVGWRTFPKASKRNEMAENLLEKRQLRLPAHLCSFREGQQHSRG